MRKLSPSQKADDVIDRCLADVASIFPAIEQVLIRHSDTPLTHYLDRFNDTALVSYQSRNDFIEAYVAEASTALGKSECRQIREELHELPAVLTANHHGIDTFSQSTQTNLLFSMRQLPNGDKARTVPVLACGNVPLNNLTYPRGLILYGVQSQSKNCTELKVPIFPDRLKRRMVSAVLPINADMLERAVGRVKRLSDKGEVSAPMLRALEGVFSDICETVNQEHASYSRQATVINYKLWHRLFDDTNTRSNLYYVELERITLHLLIRDLADKSSVAYQLMFDDDMRKLLTEELDGVQGCWDYSALCEMNLSGTSDNSQYTRSNSCGTMFFWGHDDSGSRVPLLLDKSADGSLQLEGVDDRGNSWKLPFTVESILENLSKQRLIPSLFTSYLLISIARGIRAVGGYYQSEYLPRMREAVIRTLGHRSSSNINTNFIATAGADLYLSGMQTVVMETMTGWGPAGPLEIIASGGLNDNQLQQAESMTVHDAHIASLIDTLVDARPDGIDLSQIRPELMASTKDKLAGKVVEICSR